MLTMNDLGAMGPNDWMLLTYIILGLICFLAALGLMKWTTGPKAALAIWAKENGLELLEAKRRSYWYGLFRLPRTTAQPIYRIKVRHQDGSECYGTARIGGFFGLGKHVSVVWEADD